MGKTGIIKKVAERVYGDVTPNNTKLCLQICDEFVEAITESLIEDGKLILKGFATMEVVTHEARKRRNPKTGIVEDYPASNSVKVRVSKKIKDAINGR